jgi:hypothetical protein
MNFSRAVSEITFSSRRTGTTYHCTFILRILSLNAFWSINQEKLTSSVNKVTSYWLRERDSVPGKKSDFFRHYVKLIAHIYVVLR